MNFVIACLFVATATALSPVIKNECSRPIFKFRGLELSTGTTIVRETVMKVDYEVSKTLKADDSAILNLKIAKAGWVVWLPIPSLIFSVAVSNMQLPPGIEHISGTQFKIDCRASKRFMPVCPPEQGSNIINYDFTYIFDTIKEKAKLGGPFATVLKWFASGDYRITADVTMTSASSAPREKMACFEAQVSVKV